MPPTRRRNGRKSSRLGSGLIPRTRGSSNPSQIPVRVNLQGPSLLIATQASTALLATSYVAPTLSSLTQAAYWKALFDEYRILKIKFHVKPATLANGVTKFIMDDEDVTTENKSWNDQRLGFVLSNNSSNPQSCRTFTYVPKNFPDLEWNSTYSSATYTPMALKMYTDLTNYGSPTSTNLWLVSWEALFEFRGIGANQ